MRTVPGPARHQVSRRSFLADVGATAGMAAAASASLTSVATEGLQLFAAKGIAEPLNSYVLSNKASLRGFFFDVHPVLIESMMYQGDLHVLRTEFNAPNIRLVEGLTFGSVEG